MPFPATPHVGTQDLFPEIPKRISVRAGLLSGGEQQMLALGMALARRPRVLLADELSLGLAPLITKRLLETVRRAATVEHVGVLIVEQQARRAIRYSDRVYVMRRGRVEVHLSAKEAHEQIGVIESVYL